MARFGRMRERPAEPGESYETSEEVDVGDSDPPSQHRAVEAAEAGAAMLTAAGMPRMPARVLMALVASPADGYTAAQLGDRLGVSPAAVSGAVRYLQAANMAQRVSRADSRRDRYRLFDDTWHTVLSSNLPLYTRLADLIEQIAAASDDPAAERRGTEMAAFFRFMASRMPRLLEEWEAELAAAPAVPSAGSPAVPSAGSPAVPSIEPSQNAGADPAHPQSATVR